MSVRLRLLLIALLPLIVLMPLLLLLGMTRWTADYEEVLIANVESDLRIAEQYLERIMESTGNDLSAVAASAEFRQARNRDAAALNRFFVEKQNALGLDFLYHLPAGEIDTAARWPVIAAAATGQRGSVIDIFSDADLTALNPALAARARIDLIETEAAVPTERIAEDRGMVVHAAAPIGPGGQNGVLVGGVLLNRNLQFIDTINELVYLNPITGGTRQGTATLFLDDVRVSTNVRLFEDVRALGTRVSAAVRQEVLGNGLTWLDRAFVVNDWYISGYLPLVDSFGARVGMLYVGFLEAPFAATMRNAILWMLGAFLLVAAISIPVFLGMAKGVFAPLERMTQTMQSVKNGNLGARIGAVGKRDEIAEVAGHLDDLLNQVQDRDAKLRAWAEELNDRVDRRTAELRDANAKLEATFKQLVMSEKLASIGEITAGVAHEINNPVAVIQGNVDVIRETLHDSKPIQTELNLIDQQVTRIEAIVRKLLQFARPNEYSEPDQVVMLSLVVADCLVLVDHVLSRGRIDVETEFDTVPAVRIAAGEMQQVVINLVINAAQAMNGHGTLGLRLRPEARDGRAGAALVVEDTGPGLREDVLGSVFDPFFTTKLSEGTGLGLSISQTIVQRAGGLISVENRAEGGARFVVWLPAAQSDTLAAQ